MDVPAKPKSDNQTEGYILFRQLTRQENIYFILRGAIVFVTYSPGPWDEDGIVNHDLENADKAIFLDSPENLYERVRLDTLISQHRYLGTLGPGQIAGLVEFYIGFLFNNQAHSSRLEAAKRAHILDIRDHWLSSGYVATNSVVLKVEKQKFMRVLANGQKGVDAVLQYQDQIPEGDRRGSTIVRVTRRFGDELGIRQAQFLNRISMIERGYADRVLAYDLYRFLERKYYGTEKGLKNVPIRTSRAKLGWLLGLQGDKDGKKIRTVVDKLIDEGLITKGGTNSPMKVLDREALLQYYREWLTIL